MVQRFRDSDKRKVFASYHFTTMDGKFNGFGNYVGEFNMEVYEGAIDKFIIDLEKSISMALENQMGLRVAIKVLWFK